MPSPRWRFKEKQRNDYHQEPANTEFFAQQDVADRLVRESGQNTLDATLEGQQVRLVFSLTEAPAAAWRGFFATLWPHLEAQPELREKLPDPAAPIPCLVVEDFCTSGLTGPLEPDDPEAAKLDEQNHRFFWFFKNVGRTSKTGGQLGSFGIGKTVFPYSSRINTFFGFSVRRPHTGEPPMVLLGQSQLKEHSLTGRKRPFDPFGFFAWQDGDEATYEQREICELAILEHFRTLFGLTRTSNQTGLSVVIPYPENGLSRKDLAKAALVQFFLPILSGQLTVEIRDAKERVELSAANLLEAIDRFEWHEGEAEPLKRRVRLAKWALSEGRAKLVDFGRPASSTTPKFDDSMVPAEQRRALSQQFISGQRLAFRVPTPVESKGSAALWSHVEVYLEYERQSSTKEDLYARKGLTLVDHTGQARQSGLRSILIAEDGPVYEMLRSSENVAHTRWRQKGADRLSEQFTRGPSKVGYILGIVPALVQALLSPEDEADWWTLADLFPEAQPSPLSDRPVDSSEQEGKLGAPEDDTPTEDVELEELEIIAKPRQWRAVPTKDGVRIEANPRYAGDPRPMRFKAAYGLLNRRGFGSHDAADFSFMTDSRMIEARGAAIEPLDDNVVRVVPAQRDYSVEFRGFDRRRALDYQVTIEGD